MVLQSVSSGKSAVCQNFKNEVKINLKSNKVLSNKYLLKVYKHIHKNGIIHCCET